MDPITRKEMFLAKASGQSVNTPDPITREEMFLQRIAENGGGSGSGGTSIDVTATVGQTIVVTEVDANGKPTKWEAADYQPRTHWTEVTEILSETEATHDGDIYSIETDMTFEVGKTYCINYCGTPYTCTAVEIDGLGAVGNFPLLVGSGDNGIPFVMHCDEGTLVVRPMAEVTSVTMSITEVKHTPIPSAYLSEVSPYYVQITSDGTTAMASTTPENLLAQYKLGREIYAKMVPAEQAVQMIIPLTGVDTDTGDAVFSTRLAAKHSSGGYVFSDVLILLTVTDGVYSVTIQVV